MFAQSTMKKHKTGGGSRKCQTAAATLAELWDLPGPLQAAEQLIRNGRKRQGTTLVVP
jgi:hypothetical protein